MQWLDILMHIYSHACSSYVSQTTVLTVLSNYELIYNPEMA